VKPAKLGTFTN